MPSKEPSHPLLRHAAVQGLEENLISHLTDAILGMNPTPGQGLHTLNHSPCCYLHYQSQERLSHELPGAVQAHQTAALMLSLEGNVPFKAQFQNEPREMLSKSPLNSATGPLQRPNPTALPGRSQGEGFGWHMPAPTSCLQHRTGAAPTHFRSGWMQAEMLVGFLFQLPLYLHLLFYSISADKNKSVLGEAAQMEALRVGLRATSFRNQLQAQV